MAASPINEVWRKFLALAAFVLPVAPVAGYLLGGPELALASGISAIFILAAIAVRIHFAKPS